MGRTTRTGRGVRSRLGAAARPWSRAAFPRERQPCPNPHHDGCAPPAAIAGPCNTSGCPEPGPDPEPGPPGPPAPSVEHRLTIEKLVWHDRNDEVWNELYDEVHLKINGQKVWGNNSMTEIDGVRFPNVTKDLSGPRWDSYLGSIEVWDDDTSSGDDRIGTLSVYGNGSPGEVTGTYQFTGSDAHYSMEIGLRQL